MLSNFLYIALLFKPIFELGLSLQWRLDIETYLKSFYSLLRKESCTMISVLGLYDGRLWVILDHLADLLRACSAMLLTCQKSCNLIDWHFLILSAEICKV